MKTIKYLFFLFLLFKCVNSTPSTYNSKPLEVALNVTNASTQAYFECYQDSVFASGVLVPNGYAYWRVTLGRHRLKANSVLVQETDTYFFAESKNVRIEIDKNLKKGKLRVLERKE